MLLIKVRTTCSRFLFAFIFGMNVAYGSEYRTENSTEPPHTYSELVGREKGEFLLYSALLCSALLIEYFGFGFYHWDEFIYYEFYRNGYVWSCKNGY